MIVTLKGVNHSCSQCWKRGGHVRLDIQLGAFVSCHREVMNPSESHLVRKTVTVFVKNENFYE